MDTNSLSNVLSYYYRDRFPSFWKKLDVALGDRLAISVREARFELENKFDDPIINQLTVRNPDFFEAPTAGELSFITTIYSNPHFRQNLDRRKLLQGGPFADPFIIAKAKVKQAVVVTEEGKPPHGARIPNICEHFGVDCMNLEGFLIQEDWKF